MITGNSYSYITDCCDKVISLDTEKYQRGSDLCQDDQIYYDHLFNSVEPLVSKSNWPKEKNNNMRFLIIALIENNNLTNIEKMLNSVKIQSYSIWEMHILYKTSDDTKFLTGIEALCQTDSRIKGQQAVETNSILTKINDVLNSTTAHVFTIINENDRLATEALFEFLQIFIENTVIYSDEDQISDLSGTRSNPWFKPDWSPDFLRSYNYISKLLVSDIKIARIAIELMTKEFIFNEYSYVLLVSENAEKVLHIPKVLLHNAVVASNDYTKTNEAIQDEINALKRHLYRLKYGAEISLSSNNLTYNIQYELIDRPMISIIIPNYEHLEDLRRCIDSIIDLSTYNNYEIIIVENNSKSAEINEYYELLKTNNLAIILTYHGKFNYSKINNFASTYAKGKYLLFLNNDTEVITQSWIEELLQYAQRNDVGCVGAKLYYKNYSIQHAGIILGFGGVAGNAFWNVPGQNNGYMCRASSVQNVSAVTGACLIVGKAIFNSVGGFDEKLKVAFNDVDLCLKIRQKQLLNVYNPGAQLFHLESVSRGVDETICKRIRFKFEIIYFKTKWRKFLLKGDPYYNCNLDMQHQTFHLTRK